MRVLLDFLVRRQTRGIMVGSDFIDFARRLGEHLSTASETLLKAKFCIE